MGEKNGSVTGKLTPEGFILDKIEEGVATLLSIFLFLSPPFRRFFFTSCTRTATGSERKSLHRQGNLLFVQVDGNKLVAEAHFYRPLSCKKQPVGIFLGLKIA